MNVLFINLAWDAAGVSIQQARAIDKYTNWSARHFRAIPTFGYDCDITPDNYNRDEFVTIIESADVIEFCSADHKYVMSIGPMDSGHNGPGRLKHEKAKIKEYIFGFDFEDKIKNKVKIFHDYNSYLGHWRDRAKTKDVWTRKDDIGYSAIFSSIPQAVHVYKDCIYIPDIVDETLPQYTPNDNRDFSQVHIGHYPTGDGNNKNTSELREAISKEPVDCFIRNAAMSNPSVLAHKKGINLGYDALWREFHGMTTVENLALGIPTMCNIGQEFYVEFDKFFGTTFNPFENVKDVPEIIACIRKYKNDLPALRVRAEGVRRFMVQHWSAKNIAGRMVCEYNKLG